MQKISPKLNIQTKTPPHELSACVDEIIKICPVTKEYSYTYWLRKVKKSGLNLYQVEQLLAKSQELDKKYSKCGFIVNCLKK